MNKPRWVGPETPDVAAIRAGRAWEFGDLAAHARARKTGERCPGWPDACDWCRIEDAVAARAESVRLGPNTIHGTRAQVAALRRSALWHARRAKVDDPANGITEWSGRDSEPDRAQLSPDRDARDSYHLTRPDEQAAELAGVQVRILPRPRTKPTGRSPGRQVGSGVDLADPHERARLGKAWSDALDIARRNEGRPKPRIAKVARLAHHDPTALRRVFADQRYDWDRYKSTGEVVPIDR